MGRKTKRKTEKKKNLTNSEKRIEQLYIEAIRKAREGSLLPAKQTTEEQSENEVTNTTTTKRSKRPERLLEEAIRKQQEKRRPERRTLSVPVSRLVPFKKETSHGFQFPRDFKKDETTLKWVPRANTASSCGITECDRSLWREFSTADCGDSEIFSRPSTSADYNAEDNVEQTLHIFPLRSPEDVRDSPFSEKTKSNLPPIYRTAVWREKVLRCHGNRGSIPSRGEGLKDGGSVPLLIGKEELHNRRSTRKDTMSLAERKVTLERSR